MKFGFQILEKVLKYCEQFYYLCISSVSPGNWTIRILNIPTEYVIYHQLFGGFYSRTLLNLMLNKCQRQQALA